MKRATTCQADLGIVGTLFSKFSSELLWKLRGAPLVAQGDPFVAINTYDEAIARIHRARTSDLNFVLADITLKKGLVLAQINQPTEAVTLFNQVVVLVGHDADHGAAQSLANALIYKSIVLSPKKHGINDAEFSLLLRCLANQEELPNGSVAACLLFIGNTGLARSLDLIQASAASHRLLPLVTALEQEMGRATRVAGEVDEIAKDIRNQFTNLYAKIQTEP